MFLIGSAYLVSTGQTPKMLKIYGFIFLHIILIIWWILSLVTSALGFGDVSMPQSFWTSLHQSNDFIHHWASH
jgi:hypothetical protein